MPSVFDVTSTSAGEMFLGAFVPGLLLVAIYMTYILVYAFFKPAAAPAVIYDGKFDRKFWVQVFVTLVPPLTLIFLVLGSIISGIATVNQAGAIGAAGALVMAGYRLVEPNKWTFVPAYLSVLGMSIIAYALQNYDMNIKAADTPTDMQGIWIGAIGTLFIILGLVWSGLRVLNIEDTLRGVMMETSKTTALVFIILLGAAMLTAAFRAFGGEELVREFLNSLPGGFWTQFIIVMAVIFVLGFFLDFIEIAVVVVPIVAPILLADPGANITAVWLGVMIGLNIQTSFLTPPFGFALFYLRGVAPAVVKTVQMYRGVIPFICLQLVALVIVGSYPQLVNYLPNRANYLAETAPPPRNPRFQFCLDQFVMDRIKNENGATLSAIETAKLIDTDGLPKFMRLSISGSIESAKNAVAALAEIKDSHIAVVAAEDKFRPVLVKVRGLEKRIRRATEEMKAAQKEFGRLKGSNFSAQRDLLQEDISTHETQLAQLKSEIPVSWNKDYDTFKKLVDSETKARNEYRRAADDAYEAASEVALILASTKSYRALQGPLKELNSIIKTAPLPEAEKAVKNMERTVRGVEGTNDVKKQLGIVKKSLGKRKLDRKKALKDFEKVLEVYSSQLKWRAAAEGVLGNDIDSYITALSRTIGTRQQDALSREQALYLASCTAVHRDLSLNF